MENFGLMTADLESVFQALLVVLLVVFLCLCPIVWFLRS